MARTLTTPSCSGLLFLFLAALASCVSTGKLKDGTTAYELGKYSVATEMLQEEFTASKNPVERAELAWILGESYDALNQPKQALEWFGKAWSAGFGEDALYARAQQYKKMEDYDAAIADLTSFMAEVPDLRPEITREIAACRRAKDWINGTHFFVIENLESLNSPHEDFSPVFYEDGSVVFTSGRSQSSGEGISEWTGGNYYDLFTAESSGGTFSTPEPFDVAVNGEFYEGTATFSEDFSEMVYTQCGSGDPLIDDPCRLEYRFREPDGSWSSPEILSFFSDSVNAGHPALSANGKRLYFSAAGDPEGYGGADLYYVKMTDDGWGSPINMGPTINTSGNETFPYMHTDGTLYFSSDGHPGMGGLDLYSTYEKKKRWARPENMAYPINSGSDDFGIAILPEESFPLTQSGEKVLLAGYFSSSRSGGRGSDDLYSFQMEEAPPPPPVYVLRGDVVRPVFENPKDPSTEITGYEPLPDATVNLYDASSRASIGALTLDLQARFETEIDFATIYEIQGTREKYFKRSKEASTVDLPNTPGDTFVLEARLILDPIPDRKTQLTLKDIYYPFNDTIPLPKSYPEMDRLVSLLKENSSLVVEIGAHTDSRGTDKFNDKLSQGRANSVVAYLLEKGIIENRMVAVGYGETLLKNRCKDGVDCSEEEHQENRRTTFRVIGEIEVESEAPDQIPMDPRRRGRNRAGR